eukprot:3874739-Amphidinium_carterae.1
MAIKLIAKYHPAKGVALLRCVFGSFARKPAIEGKVQPCGICQLVHTGHHVASVVCRGCFRRVLAEDRRFAWLWHSPPSVLLDLVAKVAIHRDAQSIKQLADLAMTMAELFHMHLHCISAPMGLSRVQYAVRRWRLRRHTTKLVHAGALGDMEHHTFTCLWSVPEGRVCDAVLLQIGLMDDFEHLQGALYVLGQRPLLTRIVLHEAWLKMHLYISTLSNRRA